MRPLVRAEIREIVIERLSRVPECTDGTETSTNMPRRVFRAGYLAFVQNIFFILPGTIVKVPGRTYVIRKNYRYLFYNFTNKLCVAY